MFFVSPEGSKLRSTAYFVSTEFKIAGFNCNNYKSKTGEGTTAFNIVIEWERLSSKVQTKSVDSSILVVIGKDKPFHIPAMENNSTVTFWIPSLKSN